MSKRGGKREGAGRPSKNSIIKPISLPFELFKFVKENNLSLSKLAQQKIREMMTSIEKQINKGDLVAFVEDGDDKRALVMDVKETFDTSVYPATKTGCEMTFAVVGDKVFREVYFDLENNPYFISIDESKQVLDLRIDYLF